MKKITIIGAGMSPADLTEAAKRAIAEADCVMGAQRLIAPFATSKTCYTGFTAADAAKIPEAMDSVAVLMSGDVGFYSGAAELLAAYPNARLLPGISSVAAFFAKCAMPWQDAALVSAHGRACCPAETVRRNRLSFFLTGGNVPEIAEKLSEAGFGALAVWVGQNLGSEAEKIEKCTVSDLICGSYSSLSVLIIENPAPDSRLRIGIADSEFLRGETPMTKQATRAQIAAALALREDALCWDIGCGTGSVTVEIALAAHRGMVYACDTAPEAAALTQENCRKFHISNVHVQRAAAPECLADWPAPDAAFIGGSRGDLENLLAAILAKNPNATVVMTAIALETLAQGMDALRKAGMEVEISQISAARAKSAGQLHLLMGNNPTFVLKGVRAL
ncbi:MAG: precorrin-6y C5,15-methyltransferase (decarboxylating) subunit CbiE [Firmicutes bacterium]|nr:precorrin-6y C5,15-methyltransferase (decarboxylating) subunit CbiE [Bacillota bacterium]